MSKIIFFGIPAHGHLNPTLPVAQELVQRGEQVLFYNTAEFRPKIERTGATFRAYPETELSSTTISKIMEKGNIANVTLLILRVTEQLVTYLLDELPREQPDLIIFDSLAMWGKIAATRFNIRAAGSITHFVFDLMTSNLTAREIGIMLLKHLPKVPVVVASRIRLTRRYGKAFPASNPLFPVRERLNIIFTARELHPESRVIDETFQFVGPSIPPAPDSDFLFDTLKGKRLIYISLGTVHHAPAAFYQDCFRTFADDPAHFIVSVGSQTDIAALGAIPPNFTVRPSVPQVVVLQHTDLFVTHGGLNSLHEGLYYGVPLVMIPHQLEQLMNARCIEKQGAAVVIEEQMQRGHFTAAHIRQALERVMADPSYRTAAQNLQKMLRATGGYHQAADAIQAYIVGGKS